MAEQFQFIEGLGGIRYPVAGTEAASQSFKKGAMIKMTTAGSDPKLAACASGDIPCGWAASDASGTTSAAIYYFPFLEGDLIEITTDDTAASTIQGVSYDLTVTSGIALLDVGGTTDKLFNLVDFIDAASTSGGSRVLARVVKAQNSYSV